MENATFHGNRTFSSGGAVSQLSYSETTFKNCTFSGNQSPYGAAIGTNPGSTTYGYGNGYPLLTNCILWDNLGPAIAEGPGSELTVRYSDVQGGWPGEGNIAADPLFEGGTSGPFEEAQDLHLTAYSPCIDTALTNAPPPRSRSVLRTGRGRGGRRATTGR